MMPEHPATVAEVVVAAFDAMTPNRFEIWDYRINDRHRAVQRVQVLHVDSREVLGDNFSMSRASWYNNFIAGRLRWVV